MVSRLHLVVFGLLASPVQLSDNFVQLFLDAERRKRIWNIRGGYYSNSEDGRGERAGSGSRRTGGGRRAGQWGPGNGRYGSPSTTLFVFFGLLLRFTGGIFAFFILIFVYDLKGYGFSRARPREQILQYHVKICVCFISPNKGLVHGIFPAGFLRLCDEDDSSERGNVATRDTDSFSR